MAEVAQAHKRPQGTRAMRTALPRWPRRHRDRIPYGDGADRDASLQTFDGLRLTLMRHADAEAGSSAPLTPSTRPLRMHGTTSRAALVTLSCLLLSLAPGGGRARLSAVALPAVAASTQTRRHLREASSAQEKAGGGLNVHGIELRALRIAASTASGTDRDRVLTTRHRHRLWPWATNLEPCTGWRS